MTAEHDDKLRLGLIREILSDRLVNVNMEFMPDEVSGLWTRRYTIDVLFNPEMKIRRKKK